MSEGAPYGGVFSFSVYSRWAFGRALAECMERKMRSLFMYRHGVCDNGGAQEEYGLIYTQKSVIVNPVQVCAGNPSALKKSLRVFRGKFIALYIVAMLFSPFAAEGGKIAKMSKGKSLGQIFTPDYLVRDILDVAGYKPTKVILKKHVIDNSCGDGAFLKEVVQRYCQAATKAQLCATVLKKDLETFVHGIELDEQAYHACISNLNKIAASFSLTKVAWDVRHANTLDVDAYDGKMDFVIGNPPYVRVHNLEDNLRRIKRYRFCSGGMTDLYLVFYEIGLRMLKTCGKLCYIAPSSWINSLAGHNMREFAMETGWLREIIDLGHFQPFNATAYTAIVLFERSAGKGFHYKKYDGPEAMSYVAHLDFNQCYFDNALYLGTNEAVAMCREIKTGAYPDYVDVKNGFATLADNVFIADSFPFERMVISVIKASTGKWRKAFFPYDFRGKPFNRSDIFSDPERTKYLEANRSILLKGRNAANCTDWYLYGRTQALKDVWIDKYAINTVVRDVASIKLNKAKAGTGVYSGLYILSEMPESKIRDALLSDDFIQYVRMLKKYKSGGYYTFSSKDVKQFLNYRLHKMADGKWKHLGRNKQLMFDFQEEDK